MVESSLTCASYFSKRERDVWTSSFGEKPTVHRTHLERVQVPTWPVPCDCFPMTQLSDTNTFICYVTKKRNTVSYLWTYPFTRPLLPCHLHYLKTTISQKILYQEMIPVNHVPVSSISQNWCKKMANFLFVSGTLRTHEHLMFLRGLIVVYFVSFSLLGRKAYWIRRFLSINSKNWTKKQPNLIWKHIFALVCSFPAAAQPFSIWLFSSIIM